MSTGFWDLLQGGVDYLKAVAEAAGEEPAKVDELTPAAVFASLTASLRISPAGSVTVLGEGDAGTVSVEGRERGWIVDLGGKP